MDPKINLSEFRQILCETYPTTRPKHRPIGRCLLSLGRNVELNSEELVHYVEAVDSNIEFLIRPIFLTPNLR
ncbi:hypothetical protein FHG68_00630 [Leptospira weilii]|nr:hypothetical protein FHG67_00620 [Leptospira weilii]QDK25391.1 hypothetical protein FHG68_00630 [Leptospira weilii]